MQTWRSPGSACCSCPSRHVHYPAWLSLDDAVERCRCGRHQRRMTVEALLVAFRLGR